MRIIWSPAAEADRHRIWMFLAERSVTHADLVEKGLLARCETLSCVPRQGRPKPGRDRERELSISDIRISVIYRIDDEPEAIRILRVRSTREIVDL